MSLDSSAVSLWTELSRARRRVARMLGDFPEHQESLLKVLTHLTEATKLVDPLCKREEQ